MVRIFILAAENRQIPLGQRMFRRMLKIDRVDGRQRKKTREGDHGKHGANAVRGKSILCGNEMGDGKAPNELVVADYVDLAATEKPAKR